MIDFVEILEPSILERIYLISDLDFSSLLLTGVKFGFITSLTVSIIALGIRLSIKLFES